eukprot:4398214-Pleurochrysis_carterae.AAC.1
MRVMHKRGGAGEEYWEYSMAQASLVSHVTHHRWGAADDNITPHERKTGTQAGAPRRQVHPPQYLAKQARLPP